MPMKIVSWFQALLVSIKTGCRLHWWAMLDERTNGKLLECLLQLLLGVHDNGSAPGDWLMKWFS